MMTSSVRVLGVCGCSLVLACAGCGQKAGEKFAEKMMEKAIEKEHGGHAKVDLSQGSVKVTTDQGESVATYGAGASVPRDFPEDVPVYGGAKVMTSASTPEGHLLTLTTKDAVQKVIESYQSSLSAKGWKQEGLVDMGEQKSLAFKKGERAVAIVVASSGEGGSLITLSAAKGQ
jgi:hypothetical protein